MIDLSFLTEEEQDAILKVLQRDAALKRAEEERVRLGWLLSTYLLNDFLTHQTVTEYQPCGTLYAS
ncbi:hypothetical protein STEG23_035311, partial [Scotinomys teguina]